MYAAILDLIPASHKAFQQWFLSIEPGGIPEHDWVWPPNKSKLKIRVCSDSTVGRPVVLLVVNSGSILSIPFDSPSFTRRDP